MGNLAPEAQLGALTGDLVQITVYENPIVKRYPNVGLFFRVETRL